MHACVRACMCMHVRLRGRGRVFNCTCVLFVRAGVYPAYSGVLVREMREAPLRVVLDHVWEQIGHCWDYLGSIFGPIWTTVLLMLGQNMCTRSPHKQNNHTYMQSQIPTRISVNYAYKHLHAHTLIYASKCWLTTLSQGDMKHDRCLYNSDNKILTFSPVLIPATMSISAAHIFNR